MGEIAHGGKPITPLRRLKSILSTFPAKMAITKRVYVRKKQTSSNSNRTHLHLLVGGARMLGGNTITHRLKQWTLEGISRLIINHLRP